MDRLPLQIAMRSGAYPTQVDMCVVSDQPAKVQMLVGTWDMPHVRVCGTHNRQNASEKYALLYEHRDTLAQAHQTGGPGDASRMQSERDRVIASFFVTCWRTAQNGLRKWGANWGSLLGMLPDVAAWQILYWWHFLCSDAAWSLSEGF